MSAHTVRQPPVVSVQLTPDVSAPGLARHALDRLNHGVPGHIVERLKLLVSELVTNSVVHAGLREEDRIAVSVSVASYGVHVEVSDPGPGFQAPPHPGLDEERGRGLLLVDRIADRWGVDPGARSRVWFEIDRG